MADARITLKLLVQIDGNAETFVFNVPVGHDCMDKTIREGLDHLRDFVLDVMVEDAVRREAERVSKESGVTT